MSETLRERVARLRADTERSFAEGQRHAYQSKTARTARDVAGVTWFIAGLAMGLHWAWIVVLTPTMRFLRRPAMWLARQYGRLWDRVVIVHDPYGKPGFSKTRAGLMVIATAFVWFFLLTPAIELTFDFIVYIATVRVDESVILLSSQEIDIDRNTHNIEGCWHFPCSDTDSVYFRVQNSTFNNAWNLLHGKGLFLPDYVAAAVPTVPSRCVITSFGLRWSFIVRDFNLFPQVLAVKSCDAVSFTKTTP